MKNERMFIVKQFDINSISEKEILELVEYCKKNNLVVVEKIKKSLATKKWSLSDKKIQMIADVLLMIKYYEQNA
jgi:K+/H+ antiporter YhaU regulatory subunit KhtT